MNQQYSSFNQVTKKNVLNISQIQQNLIQQPSNTYKKTRQSLFYKSSVISFVKVGLCHMCKSRSKIVYQCHKNYQATSCQKRFCLDCLVLIYKQNIIQKIQKQYSWKCPYIKKICRCKNCCQSRKQTYAVLQIDPNISVYGNLRMRNNNRIGPNILESIEGNNIQKQVKDKQKQFAQKQKQQQKYQQKIHQSQSQSQSQQQNQNNEIDQSMRCLIRQKFKRVIDFNGQLINKVNSNYHKLSEEEIKFYNKLIHSNLKVLNNIANNMIANQSLIQE